MSDRKNDALAAGRRESQAVSRYLEVLGARSSKRGKKRTKEAIEARLEAIKAELKKAGVFNRLILEQKKLDLIEELEAMKNGDNMEQLEQDFVKVARSYAERNGISYAAFREVGVPASVLKDAGIRG